MTIRRTPSPTLRTARAPRPRTLRRGAASVLAVGALLSATACGSGDGATGASPGDTGATTTASETGTVTVLAAASLRDTFTELESAFEADHPGVDVVLSFAGSADLADQILAGAPADVLATADERTMDRVTGAFGPTGGGPRAGGADAPTIFATNALTVVVPPGNPGKVASFADLERDDLRVVVCAPEVPCGAATDRVADAAGVVLHRVSEEASVTDVLAKVTSGEADAGLVYVTDAVAAGDAVEVVDVPEAEAALNRYPIVVLPEAREPGLAATWVDLVTGEQGRAVLDAAGFGPA